ncbi:MAG: SLBB domain-containing protein [Armatimonadota bacterium]|nr:SLBB domain-containing protein [bacterium]
MKYSTLLALLIFPLIVSATVRADDATKNPVKGLANSVTGTTTTTNSGTASSSGTTAKPGTVVNSGVNSSSGRVNNAGNNNTGVQPVQLNGALPETTAAEAQQQSENMFQKNLADINTVLEDFSIRISEMRKSASPPAPIDLQRLDTDFKRVEDEANSLAELANSSLTKLQSDQLQDKLFELKVAMEIMSRRWNAGWSVFGMDFFQSAPPIANPEQMLVPETYKIRNGDNLYIVVSSALGAREEYLLKVDNSGGIYLPGAGRVPSAGKTASQLQKVLTGRIKSKFKQLSVEVTVTNLATIQIQVSGAVNKPGTYSLSGLATVFTALYKAGGPTRSGTFRRISLVRDGKPKRNVDLYDFLLNGNKQQDVLLQDGDLVFIPPAGPTITIGGEVSRPGLYEPDFPITLRKALQMAGGMKPSSYLQTAQVERVENNEYKVLLNESVKGPKGQSDFVLQPGDEVNVLSVKADNTSQVEITGPVHAPGMYGYRDGMRVSDLLKLAQGILTDREVYTSRADVLRIDPVKGTEIIAFDVSKALLKDPKQDVTLNKLDRVFVYTPDQVVFRARLVTLTGSVARPGTYKRTGGMRVSDVVAAGGGLLPQAYLSRADLVRIGKDEKTTLVRVDLQAALNGDPDANTELHDRDKLTIYSIEQVQWQDNTVRIEGAVQRPGQYTRSQNMRISDLVFEAGGLLPEAAGTAEVARCSEQGGSTLTQISVKGLAQGSVDDMLLQDRDVITLPEVNPYLRAPEIVYLSGQVAKPGPYVLTSQNEKLSDVITRAGGLTQFADINGLLFVREMEKSYQERDSNLILEKSRIFGDKQFLLQLAKNGVRLPEGFGSSDSTLAKPLQVSDDIEAGNSAIDTTVVADTAGEDATKNAINILTGNKQDEVVSAMGAPLTPANEDESIPGLGIAEQKVEEDITNAARISVSLEAALKDPASPDNLSLRSGDRIHVPSVTNVVTVIGAVLHPHAFAAGPGKSVDFYVERSGGYAQDASRTNVVIVRANGDALPKAKVKSVMPGDTIVVPNTGLVDAARKWDKLGNVTKVLSDVLSSVFILTKM